MHEHGNLLMERPCCKDLQLNMTGVMGERLICYRVAEEDLGVLVGHRPSLQCSLKCERKHMNPLGGIVCAVVPLNTCQGLET